MKCTFHKIKSIYISLSSRDILFVILNIFFLVLLAVSGFWVSSCTPKSQVPNTEDKFRNVTSILSQNIMGGDIPGVSVIVMQSNNVIYRGTFGWSDLEFQIPFRENTIVNLGTATKLYIASCFMTLVDDRKISLDDPITKYFTNQIEFKARSSNLKVRPPTIAQLLSHTSGIFGDKDVTPEQSKYLSEPNLTPHEIAVFILNQELVHEPGSTFAYSSAGYQLIGRIIELVERKPLDLVIADTIFKPLRLVDTTYRPDRNEQIGRVARLYQPVLGGFNYSGCFDSLENSRFVNSATHLYSTIDESARFLMLHLNQGKYEGRNILSQNSVSAMQRYNTALSKPAYSPLGENGKYGFGWFIENLDKGGNAFTLSCPGDTGVQLWINTKLSLAVVWFTQVPFENIKNTAAITYQEIEKSVGSLN